MSAADQMQAMGERIAELEAALTVRVRVVDKGALERVDAAKMHAYLLALGLKRSEGWLQRSWVYEYTDWDGQEQSALVPKRNGGSDYERWVAEAVHAAACASGKSELAVLLEVLA
jgi:hypothetical protein